MSVFPSTNRIPPQQGSESDARPPANLYFESGSLADSEWPRPCTGHHAEEQRCTTETTLDRGNRRRRIRGAELVIRRPRPLRLSPPEHEAAHAVTIPVDRTCRVNEDSLTKECVDDLADDSAILTPSTSTDSPVSSKEGSLRTSMLECLLFELSSSSSSDCGADEVLFDDFISDDDTHR
ncbi:hypothetical protein FOZ62_011649 [Perkinsus olseni]|uniref:Uncharacterized protein n=1 Tax=Perkinsus olseni TaxID=32597 RepID=A0A7J6RGH4_PEROL|nr:hypothetical protein FOZ62_011649 [Perkinsus olseni]